MCNIDKAGFGDLILAKWKSFVNHVANKHSNHEERLFKECACQSITGPRNWIMVSTYQIIPYASTFVFKLTSPQLPTKLVYCFICTGIPAFHKLKAIIGWERLLGNSIM